MLILRRTHLILSLVKVVGGNSLTARVLLTVGSPRIEKIIHTLKCSVAGNPLALVVELVLELNI